METLKKSPDADDFFSASNYYESFAFIVIFQTNASISPPYGGQPMLMHKNSHAGLRSYLVAYTDMHGNLWRNIESAKGRNLYEPF